MLLKMKRILNKVLCFMWGHAWVEAYGTVTVCYDYVEYDFPSHITKCKHCGAHKHD